MSESSRGPLSGVRFVEMAGLGPAPFAAMMLADLGAEGICIESPRKGLQLGDDSADTTRRGRARVVIDLRDEQGRDVALDVICEADILIEGFRPGVMERLGLSPHACLARRPSLVYGRMTGWGQDGPWAQTAGHDLNYIALAGVLGHVGRRDQPPTPPLNLVGDYGGGAMLLVVGVLAALAHAQRTGQGQVVDAAMVDGSALLMSLFHSMRGSGLWSDTPGTNLLDSGAPFYDVYRTADDRWIALGCVEPQFYAAWLRIAGLEAEDLPAQYDVTQWPVLRERFASVISGRTRDEWASLAEGTDACIAPVLTMGEAPGHAHLAARGTFVEVGGIVQPAPAPRFSRTPASAPGCVSGADAAALADWGIDASRIEHLCAAGVIS